MRDAGRPLPGESSSSGFPGGRWALSDGQKEYSLKREGGGGRGGGRDADYYIDKANTVGIEGQ